MLNLYKYDRDTGNTQLVAQFQDGEFVSGGDRFSHLDSDQLTEQQLKQRYDGPTIYAVDPDERGHQTEQFSTQGNDLAHR